MNLYYYNQVPTWVIDRLERLWAEYNASMATTFVCYGLVKEAAVHLFWFGMKVSANDAAGHQGLTSLRTACIMVFVDNDTTGIAHFEKMTSCWVWVLDKFLPQSAKENFESWCAIGGASAALDDELMLLRLG